MEGGSGDGGWVYESGDGDRGCENRVEWMMVTRKRQRQRGGIRAVGDAAAAGNESSIDATMIHDPWDGEVGDEGDGNQNNSCAQLGDRCERTPRGENWTSLGVFLAPL